MTRTHSGERFTRSPARGAAGIKVEPSSAADGVRQRASISKPHTTPRWRSAGSARVRPGPLRRRWTTSTRQRQTPPPSESAAARKSLSSTVAEPTVLARSWSRAPARASRRRRSAAHRARRRARAGRGRDRGRGVPRAAGGDRHRARLQRGAVGAQSTTSCAARTPGPPTPPRPPTSCEHVHRRPPGPPARTGAFAFPLPGVGVMGFSTAAPLEPDANLLATMDSLGSQISQFVARLRAQQAVRASEARKSAILNSAFDCIITMDHDGSVVEVNRSAERTFGYTHEEMIGRELAALIVPPQPARAGTAPASSASCAPAQPRSGPAMEAIGDARGRQRVPDRADRHPAEPPRPAAVLRLHARHHRDAHPRARAAAAAEEQAALRRVATAVAASRPTRRTRSRSSPRRSRGCCGRRARTMVRFDEERATAVGAWNEPGVRGVPLGTDAAAGRRHRRGRDLPDGRADPRGQLRRDRRRGRDGAAAGRLPRRRSARRSSSAAGCGAR